MDTTLDSNDGVQQYFKGLARYLIKEGHRVRFLVPPSQNKGEFKGKVITFGKEITLKGNANTVKTVFLTKTRRIKSILRKENFDIIHIASPFSPFLGGKIIRYADCPIVSTYLVYGRNHLYRIGGFLLSLMLFKIYKKIDKRIAPSFMSKKEAELTMPGKYELIPLGVDISSYSPDVKTLTKYNDNKINILFLGRLEKRKGVDHLLYSYLRVSNIFENTRLIIAGDGPEREKLQRLTKNLKLKNVIFEGYVEEDIKPRYYATADFCVFPALYGESFGVVLIEAMSSGKPTIAYKNEGYSFVLRNLQMLLVDNGNKNKLASKMIQFTKSRKLRENYGKMCLEESKQYSWESIGERILKIYKDLI